MLHKDYNGLYNL